MTHSVGTVSRRSRHTETERETDTRDGEETEILTFTERKTFTVNSQIAKFGAMETSQGALEGVPSTNVGAISKPASRFVKGSIGLHVYTDGACQPNPGRGGWGFVAYRDGTEVHAAFGGHQKTTNQRMEQTAALMALRWLASNADGEPTRLRSDSQYTVKGCNEWRHNWKRKGWLSGVRSKLANVDLWLELDDALAAFPIRLEWVKGHAGIAGNVRADNLSWAGFRTLEGA